MVEIAINEIDVCKMFSLRENIYTVIVSVAATRISFTLYPSPAYDPPIID